MIKMVFFLLIAPLAQAAELSSLPEMPGFSSSILTPEPAASTAVPAAPVEAPKSTDTQSVSVPQHEILRSTEAMAMPLSPPQIPARPPSALDTAAKIARDLAIRVEFFENAQSYYRAYSAGPRSSEEHAAFVKFLEDYEKEQGIARRTHAVLGVWLDNKSDIKD